MQFGLDSINIMLTWELRQKAMYRSSQRKLLIVHPVNPQTRCVEQTIPISPRHNRIQPVLRLLDSPPVQMMKVLQTLQSLHVDQIVEEEAEYLGVEREEVREVEEVLGDDHLFVNYRD